MVSFFRRGDSGDEAAKGSAEQERMFSEHDVRMICVVATVALVLLALLVLVFGGSGSAFERCRGILIRGQRDMCLQALASVTSNATMCGMIAAQEQRYSCLVGVAEAENSISLCNEVNSTSTFYSQCVLNVSMNTGNESYCQLLDRSNQSSCAFGLARAGMFSSMAPCNSIGNRSMEKECDYMYYYSSAVRSGSSSDCAYLSNETNYTVMSLMLGGNFTGYTNEVPASYVAMNTSPRNYCYYDLAMRTDNSTGCSQVSGVLGTACSAAFAHMNATTAANTTNATALCALAASQYSGFGDLCIGTVLTSEAISAMNVSRCFDIPSIQYEYSCITTYAIKYTDSSYCSYIDNSTVEQQCYMSVTNRTS
jgi:hypothetical protein